MLLGQDYLMFKILSGTNRKNNLNQIHVLTCQMSLGVVKIFKLYRERMNSESFAWRSFENFQYFFGSNISALDIKLEENE